MDSVPVGKSNETKDHIRISLRKNARSRRAVCSVFAPIGEAVDMVPL